MESSILSNQEMRIYAQQIAIDQIGIKGQENLKQSRVLVIGAGGLGVTVLQNLASLGIGTLGISDNSLIQEDDLPRHNLFGIGDIGKQKAIITKEKLHKNHPQITYNIHNICISDKNTYEICANYDIIVDATKHLPTSKVLNTTCCNQIKPLVFGTIKGFQGMVTVFNLLDGHHFEDIFPNKTLDEYKSEPVSAIAPLVGIIGSYMAGEVLKIVVGMNNVANKNVIKVPFC
ncbi:MAG: HesA/MoeB/ThiF family protein [Bacteroidales bacterium]|nr:HesA/MoeB/ThiF family protein [Bacteroidales bacterium]